MPLTPATPADWAEVTRQLGRPARDIVAIAARCVCGNPTVVQTKPRLADGTPFPTVYYLTHPAATAAISTLEASGLMVDYQNRLAEEPDFQAAYDAAHKAYIHDRDLVAEAEGRPCLHPFAGSRPPLLRPSGRGFLSGHGPGQDRHLRRVGNHGRKACR